MNRATDPRRVTHLFPTFLGLRLLPVSLFFLIVGIAPPLVGPLSTPVQAVLIIAAVGAIWPIHRWYRREYGVVEPARLALGRNWMILGGITVAFVAMGLGAHRLGGVETQVLLLVLVFFVTAVLFALPRVFGGGSMAITVLAAIVILGIALLLAAGRNPGWFNYLGSLFSFSVGLMLCAAGVLEHHLLTDALGRPGGGHDV